MQRMSSPKDPSASKQIDRIAKKAKDWQGKKLKQLRALIRKADPALIEEVKWKMPSKPEGVAVWSHEGIVCHADLLKNAVRLTFHKGAQLKDPKKIFNTRMDSKTVRAIDFFEDSKVNDAGLTAIIRKAVKLNEAKAR
jgi:hypothetical protein